ncbi:CocE/NonD family hydrolase [Streptacidiphilus rugosus]|uniref:CocE/NonD family hydrolase n=1 Tax=Streptacidiphilus rugosus TaxID=405783 RepID=UPI000563208C|nr:CocE/NonD family hydrolase [Streptacidiphilus rugosus]
MRHREDLPFRTTVQDTWIPLPDGVRLHARIWRPVTDEPVPALLEYLPYRLTDWTAPRDAERHPWYAGHGYASVRVDIRGHGNSEGRPGDEYDATELADGVAVVEWLAGQPWCSGRVGMFGISWGGFNALQIAALAPPALRAVVTVCSTDNRYDNDVHYLGGSVLAVDMHAWAATMLAFVCRPPDPEFVGDRWRQMWRDRLERVEPFVHTWLTHQARDDYWRHGSVCEDYSAITAPVLAVGGWADPYRDTVLRLVAHLDAPVRGILGPWSHQYPDRGLPPGPAIGFLQETLRWWDHWLRDVDNDVMDEPLLRAWINESAPPATGCSVREGRWVAADTWPAPEIDMTRYRLDGTMKHPEPGPVRVVSPQHTGVDAARFFPFGNDADLPPDQREEDGRSVCFDTAALGHRVEILGRARVRLRLTCPARRGQVIARLCDVAPDGSSTLVTRGVLNLLSRRGRAHTVEWTPGATEDVEFELWGVGHAFPPGHRIRLALSSAYWPWVWPHPDARGFTVDPAASELELPVRDGSADRGRPPIRFEEPEQTPPLGVVFADPATLGPERVVRRDVGAGEWVLEVDPRYGGPRTYPDGLVVREAAVDRYTIREDDPISARTRSEWVVGLARPELGWEVEVRTRSEIRTDGADFLTDDQVTATERGEVVFERSWRRRIPRTHG